MEIENTNLNETPTPATTIVEEVPEKKGKKLLFLVVLSVVLVIGLVAAFLLVKNKSDITSLSLIDEAITSIETLFVTTEDIDEDMSDLDEDFLDAEVVSTDAIDESLEDVDSELEELDGLDEDFTLEAEDVGL